MLTREHHGTPRKYHNKTSGDAAAGPLTQTERQDSNGKEPVAALITVDTNPARIRVDGGSPDQGTSVGHSIQTGDFLWLLSLEEIKNLEWVSKNTGAGSEIHITLYY